MKEFGGVHFGDGMGCGMTDANVRVINGVSGEEGG